MVLAGVGTASVLPLNLVRLGCWNCSGTRPPPAGEAVAQAAGQAGRQIAAGGTGLAELLGRSGYEPRHGPGGCITWPTARSTNWSRRHAGLVCTMNLHLLRGLLASRRGAQARLDPAEGRCCVTITLP